jgi:hypothetical protein
MRVFRSKVGLWCALLALAAQLALSFGHVHWRGSTSASLLLPQAGSPVADAPTTPALPAGLTVDACAVCTLAGLGGVAPSAPALPLPAAPRVLSRISIDQPTTAAPHRLFQSRAPPQA